MMRAQLGVEIPFIVLCKNASGVPSDPDEAPTLTIYSSSGRAIAGRSMPVLESAATTGLFKLNVFLGEYFSAGKYTAYARWTLSSFQGVELIPFLVLPGGSTSGAVISMFRYEKPHATFLVNQRSSGRIYKGRNPRV